MGWVQDLQHGGQCGRVGARYTGSCLRAVEPRSLPYHAGVYTQSDPEARTWALRLSCRVLVRAVKQTLCDRSGSLVRMMRSPCCGWRFGSTQLLRHHTTV